MFKSKEESHRRKRSGPVAMVRLFISFIMLSILGFGLYLALMSFSAVDPLKLSPKSIFESLISSKSLVDLVTNILTVSPGTSLDKAKAIIKGEETINTSSEIIQSSAEVKYRFAVIADSHKDLVNLKKALDLAKEKQAKFVIGIGDFSDVGTIDELKNTKLYFDTVGLPYYVTPGDHDLWEARQKNLEADANFKEVFNSPFQSISYGDTRIILIYNSDNYDGLGEFQLNWLSEELKRVNNPDSKQIFVFGATPLFHPSSDHIMGKVTPKLKDQAAHLISIFKENGVDEAFFADTHFFSRYEEPIKGLKMTTVGAVTSERNLQTPRFALVEILTDGGYNVLEIEVK